MKRIYDHKNEIKIQDFWKKNNYFKKINEKKRFTILLPPPNVTGNLHLGHAWDSYYPDLLIRYKQLKDFNSIWYPGTDHAGIATQSKVEKILLEEENIKRSDLTREEFFNKILDFKEKYSKNIFSQWDKLGLSLNYNEIKFTLDKDVNNLVNDVFINLFNNGLIYKSKKMINWDTKINTALSNIEVILTEKKIKLYTISYDIFNSNLKIDVSTSRPETIFGDTAIAVNSKNKKYKNLIGKYAINPLTKEKIKIINDDYVNSDFGTGAMKITPSHDFNDYELSKKHNLELKTILNKNGTLNEKCLILNDKKELIKNLNNIDRFIAREEIVNFLKENNNLISIDEYKTNVPISERSGTIVEPLISNQWFLKASVLAKKSTKEINDINFYPKRFKNEYLNWINKMEDWCISRQLIWGHRIPIWKKGDEIVASKKSPGENWKQEEDVLDTWFSSSIWPIVFRKNNVNFKDYSGKYLYDLVFTGYDIIFFWISRMIFQTYELEKKYPFKNIIIHGLIRDKTGKKMSKSLNNGVNPIEVIDKWGSDSLRVFLLSNSTPGNDIKYDEKKVNFAWDFNNKIYNIKNLFFTFLNENKKIERVKINKLNLTHIDKYLIFYLKELLIMIEENIQKYNLSIVFSKINNFIFEKFSSNYLELLKKFKNNDEQIKNSLNIFLEIIIILHPFVPFLTEQIYSELKDIFNKNNLKDSILQESYLKFKNNSEIKQDYYSEVFFNYLKVVRKIKSSKNYLSNEKIILYVIDEKNILSYNQLLKEFNSKIVLIKNSNKLFNGIYINKNYGSIFYKYNTNNLKTIRSLKDELKKEYEFEYNRAKKILDNDKFIKNAKKDLVLLEKEKFKKYKNLLVLVDEIKI